MATALLVGGGMALQAGSSYMAGQAEDAASKHNEGILRKQAVMTEQAMESETSRMHDDARKMKATQRAIASGMGARTDTGTPLLVLAEEAGKMELDILEHRRNRTIEAMGLRSQADMEKYNRKQAKFGRILGMGGTLLSGASQASGAFGGSGGSVGAGSTTATPQMAGMPINRAYGVV